MARDNYSPEKWELGADAIVAPDELPMDLQHLAPLLKRWAFTSHARRDDFVEHLQRQQPEGLDEFCRQMNVAQEALRTWLAHDLQTNVRPHETAVAAALALKAFEFLKPVDHQQIVEFQIAMQSSLQAAARNKDLAEANIAFSQHRYDRVVELLCPHEDCLDALTRRKLAFAKKTAAHRKDGNSG